MKYKLIPLLFLIGLFPTPAASQNVPEIGYADACQGESEEDRNICKTGEAEKGKSHAMRATAELGFTDFSGNQEMRVLTSLLRLDKTGGIYDANVEIRGRYGTNDEEVVAKRIQGSFGVSIGKYKIGSPNLSITAEHDPFRKLSLRTSTGLGFQVKRHKEEDHTQEVSLGAGLMHTYEAWIAQESATPHRARWNLNLEVQRQIKEGVKIRQTAFLNPTFARSSDYLFGSYTTVEVMFSRMLALSTSYEYERNSSPPPRVNSNDRAFKTGLVIRF